MTPSVALMSGVLKNSTRRSRSKRPQRAFSLGLVALVGLVSACSSGSDGTPEDPLTLPSGGSSSTLDPSRVLRGEITILGQTPTAAIEPRTFSGPPSPGPAGSDVVRCSYAVHGSRSASGSLLPPSLTIAASISGRTQPETQVVANVEKIAPFSGQVMYDESPKNPLSLVVRLSHDSATSFDEYWYHSDTAVTSLPRSTCAVDVGTFTDAHVVGQIACQNLFATSASRNVSPFGTPQPTASATIAFDCPVQLLDLDGKPLNDGAGASGGAGGLGSGGASGSANGGRGGASTVTGTGGSGGTGGGATTTATALGAPCDADADCKPGLTCHYSASDYIAHRQCAAACNSSDECVAKFGADSMCIGAHICVQRCIPSTTCPAKSRCNDNGWCERSGPGSGVPYCAGAATPCSLLTSLECIGATGCSDDSHCAGVSTSCYSEYTSYSCTSQEGCYWSTSSKSCSGSSYSCSSMPGSGTCALQDGCYWTGGCSGTPRSCEDQYPSLCSNQPGCSLRTD
ncbi:MAG TPA: hypothetical protein VFK05_34835 [Polyangiaceae bacterium]|nr:hypothetical protein [Polyangiaceae bacterium]